MKIRRKRLKRVCLKDANLLLYKNGKFLIEKHNLICVNNIIYGFDTPVYNCQVVNCVGKIIVPRFFNIHSHLGECIFSNISGNDWNLKKYLEYTTSYLKKQSEIKNEYDWESSAKFAINQMNRSGTIGYCAARAYQIKNKDNADIVLGGYPFMKSDKLKEYLIDAVAKFNQIYKNNKNETNKIGLFFHSLYMNEERSLIQVKECLDAFADFITIHLSEDKGTRKLEIEKFKEYPVNVLQKYGVLSNKSILVHCGELDNLELDLIAKAGATIAVCPISNKFLNSNIINVEKIQNLGIKWCLASDGLATGKTFSLIKQGKYLKDRQPNLRFEDIFKAMTINPAKYVNTKLYSGTFEVGNLAKFLCYKTNEVNVSKFFELIFKEKIEYNLLDF